MNRKDIQLLQIYLNNERSLFFLVCDSQLQHFISWYGNPKKGDAYSFNNNENEFLIHRKGINAVSLYPLCEIKFHKNIPKKIMEEMKFTIGFSLKNMMVFNCLPNHLFANN